MNPESMDSPLLQRFQMAAAHTDFAFDTLGRSQAQETFNAACEFEAETITAIAAEGELAEKIALELQLQQRDLRKYAKTTADRRKIEQGLKDMEAGMASYSDLTERPDEYRKHASQYTDRNRDARLDVPKDGMRYAVASQITRLQNRQSLQLSDEEKNLLAVRRTLVHSIQEEYSRLQQKVVHG